MKLIAINYIFGFLCMSAAHGNKQHDLPSNLLTIAGAISLGMALYGTFMTLNAYGALAHLSIGV